jgi:hypothetical protein
MVVIIFKCLAIVFVVSITNILRVFLVHSIIPLKQLKLILVKNKSLLFGNLNMFLSCTKCLIVVEKQRHLRAKILIIFILFAPVDNLYNPDIAPKKKIEDLIHLAELCIDLLQQNEEHHSEVSPANLS